MLAAEIGAGAREREWNCAMASWQRGWDGYFVDAEGLDYQSE
jgi:hypothetical protein